MTFLNRAFGALIAALLFAGCELVDEPATNVPGGLHPGNGPHYQQVKDRFSQDPDRLVGTWAWKWSLHPTWESGLLTRTPRSTGKTGSLVFGADDSVKAYESGELAWSKAYRVERREYGNGTVSEYPMLFIGDNEMAFAVGEDTLLTSTMDRDGPESLYVRVGPRDGGQ